MRMWMIHPVYMCREHLLGEHVECHMFAASLKLGKNLNGYIEKGLLEIHNLRNRHDRLSKEILRRGYKHKSQLIEFEEKYIGNISKEKNIKDLITRCEKCKKRYLFFRSKYGRD